MVYLFQLQYAMEHQCFVSCINSWNKENSKYLIPIVSKLFHSNAQEKKKKKIKSPLILCKGSLFSACKFNCHYPYILGRLYFLIAIKITLLTKKKKKKKRGSTAIRQENHIWIPNSGKSKEGLYIGKCGCVCWYSKSYVNLWWLFSKLSWILHSNLTPSNTERLW